MWNFVSTSILAGLLAVVGTVGAGAADKADGKSCCDLKLACCSPAKACCSQTKTACCEQGLACCNSAQACCTAAPSCCAEAKACCKEAKACCNTQPKLTIGALLLRSAASQSKLKASQF